MQERQVTIGDETWRLDEPFMVMATQNPIEQEGTYQLPEAQVDRFMLKVEIEYPERAEELKILRMMAKSAPISAIDKVADAKDVLAVRSFLDSVYVEPSIEEFIVDIVLASRNPENYGIDAKHLIKYGGSPRATIFLTMAAKAMAVLDRRMFVIPQDVKALAYDVLRHRIIPSYEAEAEGLNSVNIIKMLLDNIQSP